MNDKPRVGAVETCVNLMAEELEQLREENKKLRAKVIELEKRAGEAEGARDELRRSLKTYYREQK